ncbi:MAG: zinc ribbon domain-containing protein [Methanomassiliicoccales archaeon]|nr:zinc ribbon domain-containing protein [Methanomassiliicoccales archaeon]
MGKWQQIGVVLIIFGVVTLGGSAFIYNHQMSQDGDLVWRDGNLYELHANPSVLALMTLGMIIGGICTLLGILSYFTPEEKRAQKIRPGSYYNTLQQSILQIDQRSEQLPVNFCPGCGRAVQPGATFCEGCGRRLT